MSEQRYTGPLLTSQEWVVKQFLNPGPGPGYWYEVRRVQGRTREEALKEAFPPDGKVPHGYTLEIA